MYVSTVQRYIWISDCSNPHSTLTKHATLENPSGPALALGVPGACSARGYCCGAPLAIQDPAVSSLYSLTQINVLFSRGFFIADCEKRLLLTLHFIRHYWWSSVSRHELWFSKPFLVVRYMKQIKLQLETDIYFKKEEPPRGFRDDECNPPNSWEYHLTRNVKKFDKLDTGIAECINMHINHPVGCWNLIIFSNVPILRFLCYLLYLRGGDTSGAWLLFRWYATLVFRSP